MATDYLTRWRHANPDKVRGQRRRAAAKRMEAVRAIKIERGCIDCGYADHPDALDFDHRPGTVKLFGIGNAQYVAWAKVEAEIAKCDVVCANCHRVRTATRRSS